MSIASDSLATNCDQLAIDLPSIDDDSLVSGWSALLHSNWADLNLQIVNVVNGLYWLSTASRDLR